MVKLIGSVLIFAGGLLARQCRRAECRRRLEALSDLLSSLRRMGEEIRMARTPLPLLLERLASGCGPEAGAFFRAAASAAKQGERLPEAWKQAAEALPLPEADRMAVAALGEDLHGDEETICKAISLVTYQLAKALEESFRRKPEEDKRTAALCLSGAALLVILLI